MHPFSMARPAAILMAGVALAGCGTESWSIRTVYTTALSAESSTPLVACTVPARLSYGYTEAVTRHSFGWSAPVTTQQYAPLPVTISNDTDGIVTVDWERSAFVDSRASSYRVRVYPQGFDARGPGAAPQPLDRPPAPVIAPAAHVVAFVLPERGAVQPPMFFFPPLEADGTPLKLVLSITGTSLPQVECTIRGRLEGTALTRSADPSWPRHGDPCLPQLGCAEGLSCVEGLCTEPGKPPVPARRGTGAICTTHADCAEGLRCQPDTGRCYP